MHALILLLAGHAAHAGALVVYGPGDADAAVAQVAAHADVPASDLRGANLSELVHGQPAALVGAGAVAACDGPVTTNADVEALASVAEGSVTYMEYATAAEQVAAALAAMGCLGEPVDTGVASRVLFVQGVAAWFSGDEAAARSAFRQAHQVKAGLAWDRRYPPDPAPVFTEALVELAEAPTAPLRVVPGAPDAEVYVDGQPVQGAPEVTTGDHLVQVHAADRVISVRVRIDEATPSTLLVPGAVGDGAVAWVADRGADLSAVLARVVGEGNEVYVAYGETTWRGVTGQPEWHPMVEILPTREAWKPAWWLAAPGLALAAGGGALTGVSLARGSAVKRDYDGKNAPPTGSEELTDLAGDYQAWRDRERAGWAVAGAGLVLVGAGIVVPLAGERVSVAPLGGHTPGVMVHYTGRRP